MALLLWKLPMVDSESNCLDHDPSSSWAGSGILTFTKPNTDATDGNSKFDAGNGAATSPAMMLPTLEKVQRSAEGQGSGR